MAKRTVVQVLTTFLYNPFLQNFSTGKIYKGPAKKICVPGFNCYSCPGAAGSCPIGSLQSVAAGRNSYFSFYTAGLLILFGLLFGRLVCGFLCPFGFLQDLLYKIPFPKYKNVRWKKRLSFLKYFFLLIVLAAPILFVNAFGIGQPYFCKLICPAGTLEAGIPLVLTSQSLRSSIGFLFHWKVFLLLLFICSSMIIYRPFCKFICPLGAFYSIFNPVSVYQYNVDKSLCTGCGQCATLCKMNCVPFKNPNDLSCIRCGACKEACPSKAIESGFIFCSGTKPENDLKYE